MKPLLRSFLFIVSFVIVQSVAGQAVDSAAAQEQARVWADVRKPYFKSTADDSLFVINNSDYPFRYDYYTRAEIAGFMEQMFFNARVGDVIGPFYLEGFAILYKVAGFDSTYRMNASHVFLKPEGTGKKDTLNAVKKAQKVLKEINKGLDFAEAAKKYGQDEVAKDGGNLGWFGEGLMVKPFETAVMNGKKGEVFVVQSPFGAHVVRINEDKVPDPRGRIKVIPLMKKI
jgi:peptidyl-prolyl cis-trans isomerase D